MTLPLLALLLLSGFERPADLEQWNPQRARVERVREHATQGDWAVKLTLLPADYPGLSLARPLLAGWERFDFLRLDLFNAQDQPVSVTIRLDDALSTNFGSRYNEEYLLRPGPNTLELPLRHLPTTDKNRDLDPTRLKGFTIFAVHPATPVTLYLDNVRLEAGSVHRFELPAASTNDPYRGLDHDWWPGKDVWRDEVLPRLPASNRREFEKHFYLEPYRPAPNPAVFKLNAARGQVLTVFWNGSPTATIPGELRAVRLMERPSGNGVYRIEPMALMPVTNRPHAQRFALTIRAEKPGLYHGEIAGIPVVLRVCPFELPAPNELDMTYGWYYSPPADPVIRDKELRDMAAHGCNSVTVICPRPRPDGSLDTARADELIAACRQAGLRHRLLMPSLSIAQVIAGDYAGPEFSPAFLRLFETSLRQLAPWAHQHSILANPVDEPREQALESWNRNFADTKRYLELYRAAGIPTLVTLTGDASFGKSYLPLVPLMDVVSAHPTRASAGLLQSARELDLYNAGMNRLSWGFHPWALSAKGRWEWHYAFWTEAYNPFVAGTGAVMPSPTGPLPTEAYERVRAGIDDYRFVFLLEKLIRQDPERGREAKRFLDEIRGKIPRYLEGETVGEATLDAWRERIAGFIVALQVAGVGRSP